MHIISSVAVNEPTTPHTAVGSSNARLNTFLLLVGVPLLVLLTRVPFLLAGYGMDPDGWRVACIARTLAQTGEYYVSRLPGYPVQEWVCAALTWGGPLALNGATAVFSALAVLFFILILRDLGSRDALLAGAALAFTPVIYVNSTVTMDYLWALAFMLGATYFTMRRRPALAGILLGLAIGCRMTSGVLLLPLLLLLTDAYRRQGTGEPSDTENSMRFGSKFTGVPAAAIQAGVWLIAGTLIVGVLCFLPVIWRFGTNFLGYWDDPPAPIIQLRNATTEVWGVIGCIALGLALASLLIPAARRGVSTFIQPLAIVQLKVWLFTILFFLMIFVAFPHDAGNLIPCVPFVLLTLASILPRRTFQTVCIALIISPFLFSMRSTQLPPSPPLVTFPVPGQQWCIYLPGMMPDNLHLRYAREEELKHLVAFAENEPRPCAMIVLWLMPQVGMTIVEQGGHLAPVPKAERAKNYTWDSSFMVTARDQRTVFKELLELSQIRKFQQQQFLFFYLPGAEDQELLFCGVNLTAVGARPLTKAVFGH